MGLGKRGAVSHQRSVGVTTNDDVNTPWFCIAHSSI